MIEDVKEYLCSREECLNDINESIKSCSRKDLVSVMSQSNIVKIDKNMRDYFFECNYDEKGNVFLFDEISPRLVAKYIINNNIMDLDNEIVYAYVCRTQMRVINKFYSDIKNGNINWMCPLKDVKNNKKYQNRYNKLVENRLNYPIKRLRGI